MAQTGGDVSKDVHDLVVERYRYILRQVEVLNESSHRILQTYQTLATALVGAALALFIGYEGWGIDPATARVGVVGLFSLVTLVAVFTVSMIIVGVLSWIDYRNEECDLLDRFVEPGFRSRPNLRNLPRWYEVYVAVFIVFSIIGLWILTIAVVLPTFD